MNIGCECPACGELFTQTTIPRTHNCDEKSDAFACPICGSHYDRTSMHVAICAYKERLSSVIEPALDLKAHQNFAQFAEPKLAEPVSSMTYHSRYEHPKDEPAKDASHNSPKKDSCEEMREWWIGVTANGFGKWLSEHPNFAPIGEHECVEIVHVREVKK